MEKEYKRMEDDIRNEQKKDHKRYLKQLEDEQTERDRKQREEEELKKSKEALNGSKKKQPWDQEESGTNKPNKDKKKACGCECIVF